MKVCQISDKLFLAIASEVINIICLDCDRAYERMLVHVLDICYYSQRCLWLQM